MKESPDQENSIESTTFSSSCLCGRSDYVIDAAFRSFKIVKCTNCGLLRTLPPPRPNYLKPVPRDWSNMTRLIDVEQSNRRVYEWIIDEVQLFKSHGKLLDLGCGWGQLVQVAGERGFDAVGVELDGNSVVYGKRFLGAVIVHADFHQVGFKQESFDVIIMSHVIEHLENPRSVLNTAHSLLKSDGILLVGCPNAQGFMRKIEGSRWCYVSKEHFWHFTPQTLGRIIVSCGFKPKRFRFIGLSFSGRGVYFPPLSLHRLRRRKAVRSFLYQLYLLFTLPLSLVLDRLNMTDDILMICIKQAGC